MIIPGSLVFTVSGERPGYLAEVLASWRRARGVTAWPTTFGQYGGVHAVPEDFEAGRAATFAAHREPQRFRDVAPVGVEAAPARRGAHGDADSPPLPSSV